MFFIIQAARIDMLALVCASPRCEHVLLLSEHPTTTMAGMKISIYTLKIKIKLYTLWQLALTSGMPN